MATRAGDARAAGRGAIALAVFQSVGRVIALAFLVIVTRTVDPSEFGRYSTVAAVLLIVGLISDLGTSAAATKLVSTGANANTLLADSLLACLLLGLVGWMIGEVWVLAAYSGLLAVDFAILGASLPIDACLTTILGALDGSGAITRRAIVSFLRVGLGTALGAVLVAATGSIRWAMAGLVVGPLIGLIVAVIISRGLGMWQGRVRMNPSRGWPLLVHALPFAAISGLSVVTARIDVVVLSIVASRATTATYDLAVRVLEGPLFIIGVLSGPMLYLFSRRLAAGDTGGVQRAYDQVMRLFFVCGIGISVILSTLATPLVTVVFGESYEQAGRLLTIFAGQLWLMFVCGLQGMLLAAMPEMRRVVLLIALVDGVQIAFQVAFIIVAGPVGGAASYSFGTVFTLLAGAVFLWRETGVQTLRLPPLGAILGGLCAGAVAIALREQQILIPLAAAASVYAIAVIGFGALGKDELNQLRQLLSRS